MGGKTGPRGVLPHNEGFNVDVDRVRDVPCDESLPEMEDGWVKHCFNHGSQSD